MKKSVIPQGSWTRIRPLQRDEVDPYTAAEMTKADVLWSAGVPFNLGKVMAYLPRLMQTDVDYENAFIFDPPSFRGGVQETGFNDRAIKELAILKSVILCRAHFLLLHHSLIYLDSAENAGEREDAHAKLLHLHAHEDHAGHYTARERIVLNYTAKLAEDAHLVTDGDFAALRETLRAHDLTDARLAALPAAALDRHVDAQIVELTWLVTHFCHLARWCTALQIPLEGPDDEYDFLADYAARVPADVRQRNEAVLAG